MINSLISPGTLRVMALAMLLYSDEHTTSARIFEDGLYLQWIVVDGLQGITDWIILAVRRSACNCT
jgi:hypothetical protein